MAAWLLLGGSLIVPAATPPARAPQNAGDPPPPDHLRITALAREAAGVRLAVGYPADFTNRLDIFACSDMGAQDWTLLAGEQELGGGPSFSWLDTGATQAAARFYAVGNADVDSDADGLPDARERFLFGTDPQSDDTDHDGLCDGMEIALGTDPLKADSDGDGTSDGVEFYTAQTDPTNPDTTPPVVSLAVPATGAIVWWIP